LEISGDPEKLIVSYFQGISVAEYFYNIWTLVWPDFHSVIYLKYVDIKCVPNQLGYSSYFQHIVHLFLGWNMNTTTYKAAYKPGATHCPIRFWLAMSCLLSVYPPFSSLGLLGSCHPTQLSLEAKGA
jgi:hypothetical protein